MNNEILYVLYMIKYVVKFLIFSQVLIDYNLKNSLNFKLSNKTYWISELNVFGRLFLKMSNVDLLLFKLFENIKN